MTIKNIFPIVLLCFLAIACQKEVKIDIPPASESLLFIEGMLFPDEAPKIFISKTTPFFGADVTPQETFARGAVVKISDGSVEEILTPDSTFNKFRCRWEPFYGGALLPQQGQTYTLEVIYKNKTYTASTTLDQRKVNIETIEYTPEFWDVYGGHDGVIINIHDPVGQGDFYRFQMDRMIDNSVLHAHALDGIPNDCTQPGELFPVRDIGRIVFDDEKVDGEKMEMFIEVSYEYSQGDSAWVYIQSIDENSAAFYKDLDDQLQSILNPFVEPVFVKTKIEGALGVFGSGILSDRVLFIYPQDNP